MSVEQNSSFLGKRPFSWGLKQTHSGIRSTLPGHLVLSRWDAQAVWGQESSQKEVMETRRVLAHDLMSHNLHGANLSYEMLICSHLKLSECWLLHGYWGRRHEAYQFQEGKCSGCKAKGFLFGPDNITPLIAGMKQVKVLLQS